MEPEKKQEEVINEEVVKEAVKAEEGHTEDRPEANFRAELDRKNRELERMRQELSMRQEVKPSRDPNDMRTWSDHELKAVLSNPSAEALPYKDQVTEILMDRKLDRRDAQREETNKRVSADLEIREKFPESLDPSSPLALKIDELTNKYDLSKTPAGRLVAAKLAAAELNQDKNTSDARGRKTEKDRVAAVKQQMVDGDRPKPIQDGKNLEDKRKDLADKLMDTKHENNQVDAVSQILNERGMSRDKFFGNR